ncbi:hypothetical protein [Stenotrophomonas humi]|uniref:hypothetical protein n=1 Tax=Stenotrophomonas humi TaxID=405444 RepID=UPI00137A47F7|nr:hypothetical protein [Stenotrophomonas humi]
MSNKTTGEISAEILVALIDKTPSTGNIKEDAARAAEAFKVIYAAVMRPVG